MEGERQGGGEEEEGREGGGGGSSQAAGRNESDQGQLQVVPIAPQLNAQNVNVLSGGVSQGDANNANTGQAAQQENGGQSAPVLAGAYKGDGGSSQAAGRNESDQGQLQVVPIAPQLNAQNVNVLSGGVSQGDANNANTGQAAQQENVASPLPCSLGRTRVTAAPARPLVATRVIRGSCRSFRSLRS